MVLTVKRAQKRDPNARPCTCCINKDNFRSKYGISEEISQEEMMKLLFQEKLDIDSQKMCRDGCEVCENLKSGKRRPSYVSMKPFFKGFGVGVVEKKMRKKRKKKKTNPGSSNNNTK